MTVRWWRRGRGAVWLVALAVALAATVAGSPTAHATARTAPTSRTAPVAPASCESGNAVPHAVPRADSSSLDRQAMVDYANRYACDPNPAYTTFDNDCANFVSQVMQHGGVLMRGGPGDQQPNDDWYYDTSDNHSNSWSVADDLYHSIVDYGHGWPIGAYRWSAGYLLPPPILPMPGDLIFWKGVSDEDEGNPGAKYVHASVVVDVDLSGPMIYYAQHTTNFRHRWFGDAQTAHPSAEAVFVRLDDASTQSTATTQVRPAGDGDFPPPATLGWQLDSMQVTMPLMNIVPCIGEGDEGLGASWTAYACVYDPGYQVNALYVPNTG
jgi:hypothetical protein